MLARVIVIGLAAAAFGQELNPVETIERAWRRLGDLKSYTDEYTVRFDVVAIDWDGDDLGKKLRVDCKLYYERPEKLRVTRRSTHHIENSTGAWIANDWNKQYVAVRRDEERRVDYLDPLQALQHPIELHFRHKNKRLSEIYRLVRWTKATRMQSAGKEMIKIHGQIGAPGKRTHEPIPVSVTLDAKTELPVEVLMDVTSL